jgi:putative NADH-flavin reductase
MKLIIFGATGGTGIHLVTQALAQGHTVTAFVRDPGKLPIRHSHLSIFQGDVMDPAAVSLAVKDQEAVLSALGSPANKIDTIRSQGTQNILKAMKQAGIKRFICQTSLGYGDSIKVLDRTPFYFKYLIVPFILRKGFADHALQESYIKESSLDWVIVRPGNLTDGPLTSTYRHGFPANDPKLKVKVARADVAEFMLQQLTASTYLRKTPGISY